MNGTLRRDPSGQGAMRGRGLWAQQRRWRPEVCVLSIVDRQERRYRRARESAECPHWLPRFSIEEPGTARLEPYWRASYAEPPNQ